MLASDRTRSVAAATQSENFERPNAIEEFRPELLTLRRPVGPSRRARPGHLSFETRFFEALLRMR
jgi:hypothetical protein